MRNRRSKLLRNRRNTFSQSVTGDIRNEFNIRKLVLCLLLIVCMVFVSLNISSFLSPKNIFNDAPVKKVSLKEDDPLLTDPGKLAALKNDAQKYGMGKASAHTRSMKGSVEITQTFSAKYASIRQVHLHFLNPKNYTAKGKVSVSIIDQSSGKTVCESTLDASLILNEATTVFDFIEDSEALNGDKIINAKTNNYSREGITLVKNGDYLLKIASEKVSSKGNFKLCVCDETYDDSSVFTVNDKEQKGVRVFGSFKYMKFNFKTFALFMSMLLGCMIFILLPWQRFNEQMNRKRRMHGKKYLDINVIALRILFFASPFFGFAIIEKCGGSKTGGVFAELFSLDGLLNMMIIGFLWWLIYCLCNRTKYTSIAITGICLGFGIANYVLLLFRDIPLAAADFANFGTAMTVAGNYSMYFSQSILWAIVFAWVEFTIMLSFYSYKGLPKKKRLAALMGLAIWAGGFYALIFGTNFLKKHDIYVSGFRPKWSYNSHGYTLAFFITVRSTRVTTPEDYSVSNAKDIAKAYPSDKTTGNAKVSEKTPNIIVVMNEAYSDPRFIADFKTNKDFAKYYKSLKQNTIKGTLHTSIFGGSTANTEFEFLTGNTMAYLPYHVVAYTNNVKHSIPSLATNLKAIGYGDNVAFHPGMASAYNRENVYPNLGFDKFISLESLKNPDKIRAYVSDKSDYREIIKEYESFRQKDSSSPYFMFNVTIQNHSDFKLTSGVAGNSVHIEDASLQMEEATQYLNLVKKSDDALKDLISYYQSQSEPTVVVLFGDHQPRLEDEFYGELLNRTELDEKDLSRSELQYQVPFMIWSNFDRTSKDGVDISANYLSAYVMKNLKMPMTGYDKFLMDLYKDVPVNTAVAYEGKNGKLHAPDGKSKYTKKLNKYKVLQYNNVVDSKHRIKNFFELRH